MWGSPSDQVEAGALRKGSETMRPAGGNKIWVTHWDRTAGTTEVARRGRVRRRERARPPERAASFGHAGARNCYTQVTAALSTKRVRGDDLSV